MKISHLILLSFFIILLLFSVTTFINYQLSNKIKENTEYLTRSSEIIRESNRFQRNTLNMVSGMRGYLLTGEKTFLQTYDNAVIENRTVLDELKELVYSPNHEVLLDTIISLNTTWLQEGNQIIIHSNLNSDRNSDNFATKDYLKSLYPTSIENDIYKHLLLQVKNFMNEEYAIREEKKKLLTSTIQNTKNISFFLTTASILLGLFIAWWLARNISNRIIRMVEMSNSIASGNYLVHMKDTGFDELSLLSQSLNKMADVLQVNFTELKRKNEELDQFAHVVSHDLKGPLRGISNVVSWIHEDHGQDLPPKVNEYLQLVDARILRAENLIKGILSYARLETVGDVKERVEVKEIVKEIIQNLSLLTPVTVNMPPELPVLTTEKLLLYQVFSNLISNAIKHHHKSQVTINIYYSENASSYEFFVKDDGPGIALHHQQKIFEVFQTLQERDNFESTGIGLSIVKKILLSRGERIKVDSDLGKGSVFSFTWKK